MSKRELIYAENLDNPSTPREYARIFFSGTAMGAADIVPGVSGGTMAFILGIYENLINAIKSFNLDVVKLVLTGKIGEAMDAVPWRFLLVLGTGLILAILSLANFLTWMLENEPEFLFAFFFGLVVASIVAIGARIEKWNAITIGALIVGAIIAGIIVSLTPTEGSDDTLTLFLSGMVAICAMVLPGISGSFILLLLGQYEFILQSVRDFDLRVIFTVALGCLVGITAFTRIISWFLTHREQATISLLVGFMIGSLVKIWPWHEAPELSEDLSEHASEFSGALALPDFASAEFAFALLLMLIGFAVVTALDHMQTKANPVVTLFTRSNNTQQQPQAAEAE